MSERSRAPAVVRLGEGRAAPRGAAMVRLGRQITAGPQFGAGLGLLMCGLALFAWANVSTIGALSAANEQSLHTAVVLRQMEDLMEHVSQLESGFRGYALTGGLRHQREWSQARADIVGELGALRDLTATNENHVRRLNGVDSVMTRWFAAHEDAGILLPPTPANLERLVNEATAANASGAHARLRADVDALLGTIQETESVRLEERSQRAAQLQRRTLFIALVGALFTTVTLVGLGILVLRRTGRLAHVNQMLEREVAERGVAEAALERLGRRHRLILDSAADGILELNAAGTITYLNPAALRVLNAKGHAAGLPFRDMLFGGSVEGADAEVGDDAKATMEAIAAALRDGAVHEDANGTFLPKDGRPLPVEVLVAPIRDRGEITGAVLTFRDATQRREIARMKSEFVSVVSHELRTPLTSIRGSLGLLGSGKLGDINDAGQRMLHIAVQNTDRLVRLINDILDVERIESGRVLLERSAVPARDIVRDSMQAIQSEAERVRIRIVDDVQAVDLLGDSDRLVQALTNLLSNAIKFSPEDSEVRLTVRRDGDVARISVSDQGRGIAPENLDTIFDRFRQIDSSDARKKGGSGLGLAISRGIVRQHDGHIWADSEVGRGSTFHFTIPLASGDHVNAATIPGAPLVLVCDDDPAGGLAMRQVLERNGYRVEVCTTGADALRVASEKRPAALLLDMLMPGQDGYATIERLRRNTATQDLPLVIFSVMPEGEHSATEADAWVTKPADEAAVVHALELAIRKRKPRRVLVVEDDLDLANVLVEMLERNGIEARHAATGRDAIRCSTDREPDMVILDLVLPEGDGFDVVDWMRSHDRLRAAPLVVYSAKEVDSRDRERLRLGPTEFVTKGRVAPEEFERRVIGLLRRAMERPLEAA